MFLGIDQAMNFLTWESGFWIYHMQDKKEGKAIVVYTHVRRHFLVSGGFESSFGFYKTSVTLRWCGGNFTPYRLNLYKILGPFKSKTQQDHCITLNHFNQASRIIQYTIQRVSPCQTLKTHHNNYNTQFLSTCWDVQDNSYWS